MLVLNVSYVHITLACMFSFHEALHILTSACLCSEDIQTRQTQLEYEILVPLLFIYK